MISLCNVHETAVPLFPEAVSDIPHHHFLADVCKGSSHPRF